MITGRKRLTEGAADGLFTKMLPIEPGFALPMANLHPRIECAQRHHMAQSLNQLIVG